MRAVLLVILVALARPACAVTPSRGRLLQLANLRFMLAHGGGNSARHHVGGCPERLRRLLDVAACHGHGFMAQQVSLKSHTFVRYTVIQQTYFRRALLSFDH